MISIHVYLFKQFFNTCTSEYLRNQQRGWILLIKHEILIILLFFTEACKNQSALWHIPYDRFLAKSI